MRFSSAGSRKEIRALSGRPMAAGLQQDTDDSTNHEEHHRGRRVVHGHLRRHRDLTKRKLSRAHQPLRQESPLQQFAIVGFR